MKSSADKRGANFLLTRIHDRPSFTSVRGWKYIHNSLLGEEKGRKKPFEAKLEYLNWKEEKGGRAAFFKAANSPPFFSLDPSALFSRGLGGSRLNWRSKPTDCNFPQVFKFLRLYLTLWAKKSDNAAHCAVSTTSCFLAFQAISQISQTSKGKNADDDGAEWKMIFHTRYVRPSSSSSILDFAAFEKGGNSVAMSPILPLLCRERRNFARFV